MQPQVEPVSEAVEPLRAIQFIDSHVVKHTSDPPADGSTGEATPLVLPIGRTSEARMKRARERADGPPPAPLTRAALHAINSPDWRLIAATSLAGVRGAVSLSGVMTLPLFLDDGSSFAARDLAILLAAGVIVVTLVALRARTGFNINQLIAEYRALRVSVLRLWIDDCEPDLTYLDDVVRFDEAMDQALAESVCFFSAQVEQSRNLLLGMLGHDMRSPLQAIQITASHLAALNADEKVSDAAARLIRSGARMQALLDDLSDFNWTQLG
ncbi:hypothetical protein LMG28727_06580 [Paraburkholderia kirstenboschensis]|nr:hypothetical protein LMG28727_06580 [Paraburkholderia kirstenboschensis]